MHVAIRPKSYRGARVASSAVTMFGRLLPRETSFFDYFEQHAALTIQGAREFFAMLLPRADIAIACQRIAHIELETDLLTHRCVEALHKMYITPIDRNSIHRLITKMDDVMDYIDAAAQCIELYELTVMNEDIRDLADIIVRACEHVGEAVRGLRTLRHPAAALALCQEINRLESDADAIMRRAVARLFKESSDPLIAIKWKEVFENLEMAADRCEDVATIVEGVILEHT
jgi:predicted phosphate transport protein (TIGR00153 family)